MVQISANELAGRLAEDIAAGLRAPGERMPSVRSLAREAGCAAGTAARALTALRDTGVIAGRERARFSVTEDGPARAARWRARGDVLRLGGSDDPAYHSYEAAAAIGALGPRFRHGQSRSASHARHD